LDIIIEQVSNDVTNSVLDELKNQISNNVVNIVKDRLDNNDYKNLIYEEINNEINEIKKNI